MQIIGRGFKAGRVTQARGILGTFLCNFIKRVSNPTAVTTLAENIGIKFEFSN